MVAAEAEAVVTEAVRFLNCYYKSNSKELSQFNYILQDLVEVRMAAAEVATEAVIFYCSSIKR